MDASWPLSRCGLHTSCGLPEARRPAESVDREGVEFHAGDRATPGGHLRLGHRPEIIVVTFNSLLAASVNRRRAAGSPRVDARTHDQSHRSDPGTLREV